MTIIAFWGELAAGTVPQVEAATDRSRIMHEAFAARGVDSGWMFVGAFFFLG